MFSRTRSLGPSSRSASPLLDVLYRRVGVFEHHLNGHICVWSLSKKPRRGFSLRVVASCLAETSVTRDRARQPARLDGRSSLRMYLTNTRHVRLITQVVCSRLLQIAASRLRRYSWHTEVFAFRQSMMPLALFINNQRSHSF